MADGDQRIEVLEDEMKVLKGEVSRTLVDLRALLMQEESPLMTGRLANRVGLSGEAGAVTQVNLAPVVQAPAPTAAMAVPGPPDEAPSALAGLPALGGTEMPEPPGSPDEGTVPSPEPESPVVPDAPLVEAPAAVGISLPPATAAGDFSLPDAPTAGDFSLPDASPAPAPQADAEQVNEAEDEQREERLRSRKARLQEEEALAEAERALRARKRESDQQEEAAEQEARDRRKKRSQEDAQKLESAYKPGPLPALDPVEALRNAQMQDAEDEEQVLKRKARLREEQELEASQRAVSSRKKEREQQEEQDRQVARDSRKKQAQEEDEEQEERSRRRKRERAEEEEYQDSRGRRDDRGPQGDGRSDQLDRLERLERSDQLERLERLETRRRRSREDEDRSAGPDRWDRDTLSSEEEDQQIEDQYESELEDDFEHLEGVRRRDRDLEEEMENFSESGMSEGDLGPDRDSGPETGSIDLGPGDESNVDLSSDFSSMALDLDGVGSEDTEDSGDGEFGLGDGLGYQELGGEHEDSEYERELDLDSGSEDEFSAGLSSSSDGDYSDDWDGPAEPGSPQADQPDDYDSHEYQEGPKINGNRGSRGPRSPEAARRAYESDNYYPEGSYRDNDGNYQDDRHPGYRRRPQNAPRDQRPPRPVTKAPMGRRPATGDYGYSPDKGYGLRSPEFERWPSPQEWEPDPPPMDLNLVSNLVRWASMAKNRVGEKRLTDIIELYVESRNTPPGLSQALNHIASIVDDQPPESGQTAQETMDLIAHLHGILAANLPAPSLPQIHGPINFTTGNSADSGSTGGSGKGDW